MPTHPLPALADGRLPVVSSGYGPRPVTRNGQRVAVKHNGADVTYRAAPGDPAPKVVNGRVVYTPTRTKAFYSPPGQVVVSAEPGVVVQAKMKPGINGDVWVHHPASGLVTRYAHLSRIDVREGQRVDEGQALGVWGAGHGTPFIHLHFELLTAGKKNSQRDPASYLAAAQVRGAIARPLVARRSETPSGGGFPWLALVAIGVVKSIRR